MRTSSGKVGMECKNAKAFICATRLLLIDKATRSVHNILPISTLTLTALAVWNHLIQRLDTHHMRKADSSLILKLGIESSSPTILAKGSFQYPSLPSRRASQWRCISNG